MTRRSVGRPRRGFVVPTVLLLAAILSAAVAGAYTYLNAERRTNDNRQAEIEAMEVANAGLQKFLIDFFRDPATFPAAIRDSIMPANWIGIRVASDSSVTVRLLLDVSDRADRSMSGGTMQPDTAEVKAYIMRRALSATDSSLWLIRSRGVASRRRAVGEQRAERIVTAYAWVAPGDMNVVGGWVSLTGITRAGAAGQIRGDDECGQKPTVPAAVVPNEPTTRYQGSTSGVVGGVDSLRSSAQLTSLMNINWALVGGGQSPPPDFVLTSSSRTLSSATCIRWATDTTYYPTILVQNGNPPLFPGPGWEYSYSDLCPSGFNGVRKRALLIVQGDFRTQGASGGDFSGIALVGEKFTANGTQNFSGAVVSGLRRTVDSTYNYASEDSDLNGTKVYRYNSCNVKAALARLSGLRPVLNTWADGWTATN